MVVENESFFHLSELAEHRKKTIFGGSVRQTFDINLPFQDFILLLVNVFFQAKGLDINLSKRLATSLPSRK